MDKVKVHITNRQKEVKIPTGIRLLIRRCCNAVLRMEDFAGNVEVSVISVEKAVEQAELYGHTLQREIGFLTVHSMLHLLGYDHEAGGLAAALMREKEEEVLERLGLTRDVSYTMPRIPS